MKLLGLFLLFVLCLCLPSLFVFLEGLEYSTELLDKADKYTTTPEERAATEKKIEDLLEKKKLAKEKSEN
jgi:hypothetical protein